MNLIQVTPPTRQDNPQWWPDLFLKKGRQLQPINLSQCLALSAEYRNRAKAEGRGASETPQIKLYDADSRHIAVIHRNGRSVSVEGMEIPTPRTAEQIAAAIGINCDDVHNRRIEWEEFSRRNRALWIEAEKAGLARAVTALVQ